MNDARTRIIRAALGNEHLQQALDLTNSAIKKTPAGSEAEAVVMALAGLTQAVVALTIATQSLNKES